MTFAESIAARIVPVSDVKKIIPRITDARRCCATQIDVYVKRPNSTGRVSYSANRYRRRRTKHYLLRWMRNGRALRKRDNVRLATNRNFDPYW